MKNLYQAICQAKINNQKLVEILLDPEKIDLNKFSSTIQKIKESPATHILLGGSTNSNTQIDPIISQLKQETVLPIVLFPGNPSQISALADGVLFLMLLSGRNPTFLIEHQVNAVAILENTKLEVISTGYILIESGRETAVERVSQTKPLDRNNPTYVAQTAKAGEYIGNKLIYLEAGSGAKLSVPIEMIAQVCNSITIPLIVGGGIRSQNEIQAVFDAGADMVVIGTAFEENDHFFNPKTQ